MFINLVLKIKSKVSVLKVEGFNFHTGFTFTHVNVIVFDSATEWVFSRFLEIVLTDKLREE